jgi:antitoxin YefM
MKIMSYTKARKNLRGLIDEVVETSTEAVITSKKEGKDVVMMSLDDYNGWATTNHLLSTPSNASRLLRAVADVNKGKVIERDLLDE